MGAANMVLRKRLRRWLDAAHARRAFDAEGSLSGLSAGAIADQIAGRAIQHLCCTLLPMTGVAKE